MTRAAGSRAAGSRTPGTRATIPAPGTAIHVSRLDPTTRLRVALIGVGGSGSLLLGNLLDLHRAIVGLGGAGLHVTAYDPGVVREVNLARQRYHPCELGSNKAVALLTRVNLSAGLDWRAVPRAAEEQGLGALDVLFSCTDSKSSRRALNSARATYWIDCGNDAHTGQVLLGEPGRQGRHLPTVLESHGWALKGRDDDAPSCSAHEALTRQDLMVNREVALHAARLLWQLCAHGQLASRGVYLDTHLGMVQPLMIEADMVAGDHAAIGLLPPEA